MKSPDIVERLGRGMHELKVRGITVTEEALYAHSDFTRDEIRQHGADARRWARANLDASEMA